MLKNYFRGAFRNLTRNKFAGSINIGGLAIGMAVAILIGGWVYYHLSYNKSFPQHSRIASVLQNQTMSGNIVTWTSEARQLTPALQKDYPTLFKHVVTTTGANPTPIAYGESKLNMEGAYADPAIVDMLDLDMRRGDTNALSDESSIILSNSAAKNLFGNVDPLGKTLKVNNTQLLKVTGVYADLPENSDFADYNFIIPFQYLVHSDSNIAKLHWGNSWFNVFAQLNDNVDMAKASNAIKMVKARNAPGEAASKPELFLQSMDRWHLHADFKNGVEAGGFIQYVRLFTIIGIIVLVLACINFMNLSTARSEKRAREVGIRKTLGSGRGQLLGQFFSESILTALLAFILAIGIAQLLLPLFSSIAGQKMTISYGQPMFWVAGLVFVVITGVLAGSYPALYLSAFRPVKVLKGSFKAGNTAAQNFVGAASPRSFLVRNLRFARLRRILVVVQFAASVILIIGSVVVFHQIQYVKDRSVGYDRNSLIEVSVQNDYTRQHFEALRTQLIQTGMVEDAAGSRISIVTNYATNMNYNWRGKDPSMTPEFGFNLVTPQFGKVAGWQLVEGRDFSSDLATDKNAYVINEAAARYMGFKHPVGEVVLWNGERRLTIIGVVKDMITQSPFEPARQMLFSVDTSNAYLVNIRVKPQAGMTRALAAIQDVFKRFDAENPFKYTFADQQYAIKFADEERVGQLAGFFTILAIFISCLGLLGLSAFVAEQRTREVGIRKILGASVLSLWNLLSKEFIALVGLSLLIGVPLGYWIMRSWLNNFAYHADLSWWIFAVTAGCAIGITLVTVSFQTVRAALINPAKTLRSE
jgi:putative ABC transport system permease protein